mmetsp:Transcript_1160/g.3644  ORF Transcript_1160/g.3644 Transcript_1160/m.3644 type:complete len:204 (+) Transcript_1160:10-621(+)
MATSRCALALAALGLIASSHAEPFVMLMKRLSTETGVYNEAFTVELKLFNTGDADATALEAADRDWPVESFDVVKGSPSFSVKQLAPGENVTHSFTVRPKAAGVHKPIAATVTYAGSASGLTITHTSNDLPPLAILSRSEKLVQVALFVGRVLSLNFVRTVRGWLTVVLFWMSLAGLVGLLHLRKQMQVWRHQRAMREVEKMK